MPNHIAIHGVNLHPLKENNILYRRAENNPPAGGLKVIGYGLLVIETY